MRRNRYRRWPSVIGSGEPFPALVGLGGVLVRGLAGGAAGLDGWFGGGSAPDPGLVVRFGPTPSSSSRETTPTLTASRRARALARVSATRIRCGRRKLSTLPGSASPRPS